jgi:hypothetical protein
MDFWKWREVTMTIRRVGRLRAAFKARRGNMARISNASALQGQYAFKVQGENVGVLDSRGVVHPFTSPLKVTAVGQFTFDGSSTFTRTDFNVSNGAPTITATTPLTSNGFRTGQSGTYTVDADCTGNILLEVPGGREIHIAIAVVENGQGVYGVVEAEHAPSLPAALVPSGLSCDAGCDLGDNILLDLTRNRSHRK